MDGAKGYHARPTPLVERGDTLTFSAWTYLFPAGAALPRANRLHVIPLPVPTATPATAATDNTPGTGSHPGLLQRLGAGLALVGWGGAPAQVVAPTTGAATQVWLRYRVFNESGTQVAEHYEYQSTDNATTVDPWRQLRTAVRVQQGGTVEVAIGSDDPNWQAYFDDLRLEQTGGLIVQEQHQYAYGSPLVGLNYAVGNKRYRYGYQGQFAEKDAETGFESFELRLYNDRIGRWTSNDPEGQFSSPYVGMGNNPVSGIDSDGGWSWAGAAIGAGAGALIGGGIAAASGGDFWKGAAIGLVAGGVAGGLLVTDLYRINTPGNHHTVFKTVFDGADWGAFKYNASTGVGRIGRSKVNFAEFLGKFSELPSPYNRREDEPLTRGALMQITNNSSSTRWVQTVSTNKVSSGMGQEPNVPFLDNHDKQTSPFYNSRKNFLDTPNRPWYVDNVSWTAELSKVRLLPNGKVEFLGTITYGFSIDKYHRLTINHPRIVPPSTKHMNLYNNWSPSK